MDSDLNYPERIELLNIMFQIAESALLWVLIVLSTISLLFSWLIGNLTNWILRVCRIIVKGMRKVPGSLRTFLIWFLEMLSSLSHMPGICLAAIFKLYQQVCRAVISCLTICKSIPLQKDDLCDQIGRGGVVCVCWTRQQCLNINFCCFHLWSKVSHAAHHVCQVCIIRFQSHCPKVSNCLARCWTAVLTSVVISCLGYASSNILRISVLYMRQVWTFIVWVFLAVFGSLIRQLDKISKWFCHLEASDETKRNHRPTWMRSYQGARHFRVCCSSSMMRWQMPHFRCNPQSSFYAIIVFVAFTFVLMTYLYSGSFMKIMGPSKTVEQSVDNLRMGQIISHRQIDRPVKPTNRLQNNHEKREKPADDVLKHPNSSSMRQVLDVINLISKLRSPNESSTLGIQKKMLQRQIKLLREAMTSNKTMLPNPPATPACVGNLQPGEVEDILCIPRPKFLSHIKNPCWYTEGASSDGKKSLNCLPYFHILGCAKSGTTDLWNRLMSHPHTVSNDGLLHKEALWWSWYRYGISGYNKKRYAKNFTDYVSLFQDTARQIQSSVDKETLFHQILITGDASPPDFWDFRGWTNISQNRKYDVPMVITPHLMRHMYPNPKFIIMFRDPIDRLYSDYFFVGLGLTAQDFHNDIMASVDMLAQCVEHFGLQRCFYDQNLYVKLPVRLPFACYSVFMREWLRVFPLENFLFIKTEEYEIKPEETLKSAMDFLGLGPLKDTQLQVIAEEERSRITAQRQVAGPMKNATKIILEELLGDCNIELRKMIKSDRFTWS